jgi:hypothetical protein
VSWIHVWSRHQRLFRPAPRRALGRSQAHKLCWSCHSKKPSVLVLSAASTKFVAGDAAGFGSAQTVVVATSVMDPESDAGYPQQLCPHPVAMRERVAGSWDRRHQKGLHARSRCSCSGHRCFPFTRRERTGFLPRPQGVGCRNRSQSPQRRTGQGKPPLTSLLGFSSRNPRRRLAF